jgi:putative membrane protein
VKRLALAVLTLLGVVACRPYTPGSDSEAGFVVNAASVGRLELQLAADAITRAASADVRELAYGRIADHRRAYRGLERAAAQADLGLPDEMTAEHQDAYVEVAGLRGEDFDRAYLKVVIEGEEAALHAFKAEAARSQSDIAKWAADSLPTLERQLADARKLADKTLSFASVPTGS